MEKDKQKQTSDNNENNNKLNTAKDTNKPLTPNNGQGIIF